VGRKADIEELKRVHSRQLLRLPGVSGVGVERVEGQDEYVLVIHVENDDETTRAAVVNAIGNEPVRLRKSGPYRKL
jgi:hypothetical protein